MRCVITSALLVTPMFGLPHVARSLVDHVTPTLADVATSTLDEALAWRTIAPSRDSSSAPEEPAIGIEPITDMAPDPPSTRATRKETKPHRGIVIRADAVARAVRSGGRPSGVPAPATSDHPAGLSLVGVNAFGTGLRDGDIVTSVGGAPATSVSAVIGAVAGALGHGARVITGVVWRDNQRIDVAVEIPDPKQFAKPRPRKSVAK